MAYSYVTIYASDGSLGLRHGTLSYGESRHDTAFAGTLTYNGHASRVTYFSGGSRTETWLETGLRWQTYTGRYGAWDWYYVWHPPYGGAGQQAFITAGNPTIDLSDDDPDLSHVYTDRWPDSIDVRDGDNVWHEYGIIAVDNIAKTVDVTPTPDWGTGLVHRAWHIPTSQRHDRVEGIEPITYDCFYNTEYIGWGVGQRTEIAGQQANAWKVNFTVPENPQILMTLDVGSSATLWGVAVIDRSLDHFYCCGDAQTPDSIMVARVEAGNVVWTWPAGGTAKQIAYNSHDERIAIVGIIRANQWQWEAS